MGYSASFTGILTKHVFLAQQSPPKSQEILHILQVVHSKSSTFTMVNPKKLGIAKYLFYKYYTQYLFNNFI